MLRQRSLTLSCGCERNNVSHGKQEKRDNLGKSGKTRNVLSTQARHLRRAGVSRKELLRSDDRGYRRFEVENVHVLWQADFKRALYLPTRIIHRARKRPFCSPSSTITQGSSSMGNYTGMSSCPDWKTA